MFTLGPLPFAVVAVALSIACIQAVNPLEQYNRIKALGQAEGLCPLTRKTTNQDPLDPPVICPSNVGPFWYICNPYDYDMAADACAAYGWRLAMLTEESASQMAQLVLDCAGPFSSPWIGGVNGLAGDPCVWSQAINGSITAYANLGTGICDIISAQVICEEIPQEIVSVTGTVYDPIIPSGATTTTVTSYRTRTIAPFVPTCTVDCASSTSDSFSDDCTYESSDSDSSWDSSSSYCHLKSGLVTPPCYGVGCLPVCPTSIDGIHMITASVNYTDTAVECAKYGWSVLDFTNPQSSAVIDILNNCKEDVNEREAYIRSFNGVSSVCMSVRVFSLGAITALVEIPGSEEMCAPQNFVLCQERCPFPVAPSGVDAGLVSVTTILTGTTATLTTPTTTIVVTETCTESIFI